MGTVRKIGECYYIEFIARGLLYQRKGGPDKKAAERLLEEVEGKIAKGEMEAIVRDVDRDVFFKTFLEHVRREQTDKTYARHETLVHHFQEFCSKELSSQSKLSSVTPRLIEDYRAQLISEGKPRLINFTLLLLKDVLDFAIKLGYLNDNPTLHIQWVDGPQQRKPRVLTPKEIDRILTNISGGQKDVFTLLLRTGIRLNELRRRFRVRKSILRAQKIQLNPLLSIPPHPLWRIIPW